jgi:hypothetical protein
MNIHSPKAVAELKAAIAKEKSTAKTAKVPATKAAAFAKAAKQAEEANAKWERPNLNALCRKLAGGDMAAGLLLAHVLFEWRNRKHKLERNCLDWLAHTREAWAGAAGLTLYELKDRALPRLKRECHEFLTIKAQGHGPAKKLWISVDDAALREAIQLHPEASWEAFWDKVNHVGPGNEKQPANAYLDPFK